MSIFQEIEQAREQLLAEINVTFDEMRQRFAESGEFGSPEEIGDRRGHTGPYENIYLLSTNPSIFKGKKPVGVLFGESGRVNVGSWKMVLEEVLKRCDSDPGKHVALMNLRGKISGRNRVLLAKEVGNMRSPIKIAENLYIETHYDTETLLRILLTRVLDAVDYDYSGISVAVRNG